jgi:hypothetical protein
MGNSGTERQSLVLTRFSTQTGTRFARNATSTQRTKRDSGKRFMTGALTAGPHLWQRGGLRAATIRPGGTPCPEINRKSQNLRHKSHSYASAARNGRANAGLSAGFADNGINGIVAFGPQICRCERKTFDWK